MDTLGALHTWMWQPVHSCHRLPETLLCGGWWLDSCFLPIGASPPASEEGGSTGLQSKTSPQSYRKQYQLLGTEHSSGTAYRLDRELQACSFPERSPVLAWVTSAAFEPPTLLQVTPVKSLRWILFLSSVSSV